MYQFFPHHRSTTLMLAAAIIVCFTCCQKQNPILSGGTESDGSPGLIVAGPPQLILWFKGPEVPITDQIPGDVPVALEKPIGFSINGKGYVCGGITETGTSEGETLGNLFEWDTTTKTWSQKANFPGTAPIGAETFTIGNSAYVCNGDGSMQNWRYDQLSNTCIRRANAPNVDRYEGVAFAINGKGYLGLGDYDPPGGGAIIDARDWWQYDPSTDQVGRARRSSRAPGEAAPWPLRSAEKVM